ncbi:alpha/beta hydrolase [Oceanicola sp. 22II-s10i]|uniref:alpha/beta fold hydrolase n=1 Tax=Oceanicola sp. 22II-s10i TaxID=1317116 RepID=UPI000B5279C7|nr:alpha/beta hydrolase [Oceanicola sp. 22II-s10i]OWU84838.1 alpha/beta hydrolase [Oceanicola sp. 22II-s10i]
MIWLLSALRIVTALVLIVAVIAALTLWRVSSRRAAAEAAHPPEGSFVEVDGQRVHYVQKGQGPDVVLIHGASGNTRDMTFSLVDRLAGDFRVTAFDRPGMGYTPRMAASGVTVTDQARLLSGAAQALDLDRPVVVGQSFGGAVAMAWATRFPDRAASVVLLAGATYPWPGELDRLYVILSRPVIGPILTHLIAAWVPMSYIRGQVDGVFTPQDAPAGYDDAIGLGLIIRPETLRANAQQRTDLRPELRALSHDYPGVDMPIEILHGTADDIVGLEIHSEALERDAPDARLTRLPGIGHMPHHVAQDAVLAAIRRAAERAGLR